MAGKEIVWQGINGVVRTTYIVDEKGMIEKAYPNANPDTNAEEILAYLKG